MLRTPLIAANWKMNMPPKGFDAKDSPYQPYKDVDVVVFPAFLDLQQCVDAELNVGAQYGHPEKQGAYTGDVSMAMIREVGCEYVLCGHSERRRDHRETDVMVHAQVEAALAAGLIPIVCVGETEEERSAGAEQDVVRRQLEGLPKGIVIAYEPVWAISGGDPTKPSATPDDAQKMHAYIRSLRSDGEKVRILYGGSMNAKNCQELLACPDIDGGLIGGASLKPAEFRAIVDAAAGKAR